MSDSGTTTDDRRDDEDALTTTQSLICEVLAARHRTGETQWTFQRDAATMKALNALNTLDLVGWDYGITEHSVRASLTVKGEQRFLLPGFQTPFDRAAAELVSLRGQLATATELAEHLTVTCRYHGHHIERTMFGRAEPCCDTGREAVRNVRLIAALGGAR